MSQLINSYFWIKIGMIIYKVTMNSIKYYDHWSHTSPLSVDIKSSMVENCSARSVQWHIRANVESTISYQKIKKKSCKFIKKLTIYP